MKWNFLISFLFVAVISYGQEMILPAGGSDTLFSYSIGQVVYQTDTDRGFTIIEGLQQPRELYVFTEADEIVLNTIQLYPNPVQRILSVNLGTLNNSNTICAIYNLSGRKVYENTLPNKLNTINVQQFVSGLYLVKITDGNNLLLTKKIIKR